MLSTPNVTAEFVNTRDHSLVFHVLAHSCGQTNAGSGSICEHLGSSTPNTANTVYEDNDKSIHNLVCFLANEQTEKNKTMFGSVIYSINDIIHCLNVTLFFCLCTLATGTPKDLSL